MENKEPYQYLTIPLHVIKNLHTRPKEAMYIIIVAGIYQTASYIKTDIDEAVQQLMYCYFRQEYTLTDDLRGLLDHLYESGGIYEDEDYSFFSTDGTSFYVDKEYTEGLYDLINNDDDIKEQIIIWHKIRQVRDRIDTNFPISDILRVGKEVLSETPYKDSLTTIKKEMALDFFHKNKSAYERDMLACYLGVRSKLGKKEYCATTKKEILRRMIGCTNQNNLPDYLKIPALKKIYEHYNSSNQKRLTKLLEVMEVRKFLVRLPTKKRRTYITTSMTDIELARKITEDAIKKEVKEIEFRERKKVIAKNIERLTNKEVEKYKESKPQISIDLP